MSNLGTGIWIWIGIAAIMLLPVAVGHIRHARAFRTISTLAVIAGFTLVCCFVSPWFLLAAGVLWVGAWVLAFQRF